MTGYEIRKKFLDFFASKGHKIIASDSLVPKNDPTVLFTTAGMQQFKRQFLGHTEGYTRAATSQKCLRTDDLDEVGKTNFHHTFFEMLGNFSFGDYFKKDAICWAWEFLTEVLKIQSYKLWVSVYHEDKEAEEIWLNEIKIPDNHLVKLGDKSNFWPSEAKTKGPNGPCGPCSEIFYDYGSAHGCGKRDCSPECDCGRFSEIWNLVFTQFNRQSDGTLEPLPNKNIDTGMGLERLTSVMQGKKNNFETDLFAPILMEIDKIGCNFEKRNRFLIADHIRAIVFGICDGVIPSNEGRGYVIKRLIIDSADIALRNDINKSVVHRFVRGVVNAMEETYPELVRKKENIAMTIQNIENAYIKVRAERIPELKKFLKDIKNDSAILQKLGELIFKYRDTYGLTLSTIHDTTLLAGVGEEKWNGALKYYTDHMEQQKERSRKSSKMTGDVFTNIAIKLNIPKTIFLGYNDHKVSGKILKMFLGDSEIAEAKKGDTVKVILNQTPFYAESGGQIGDIGTIRKNESIIKVRDVRKISDVYIHEGSLIEGSLKVNDSIEAHIDSERRLAIMRNHTATHLLQAALRDILGDHVQQQGSLVAEDRLRFDFTHPKAVTEKEIKAIERWVNERILSCKPVEKKNTSLKNAKDMGALAFFAEKYSDEVRVVSIPGESQELCGGTHVNTVGQIGLFRIVSEGAVAQGIRRVEAITGKPALDLVEKNEERLENIVQIFKANKNIIVDVVNQNNVALKKAKKDIEHLRVESIKHSLDDIISKSQKVKHTKVICHQFDDIDISILRKIADQIKHKTKSAVIALASKYEENAFILVVVTDDVIKHGLKANEIISEVAPIIHGSGGGRPQMAQAGSKDSSGLKNALSRIGKIVKGKL